MGRFRQTRVVIPWHYLCDIELVHNIINPIMDYGGATNTADIRRLTQKES